MSDSKPRRVARHAGRGEFEVAEAAAPVSPEVAAEPAAPAPAIEPTPPVGGLAMAQVVEFAPAAEDAWSTLSETQAALVRGCERAALEMTGMTRAGFAATADAAVALLGAKTLAEIVEINAGLTRRSCDAFIEGAAKLSEIAVKAVAEVARPLLTRVGAA